MMSSLSPPHAQTNSFILELTQLTGECDRTLCVTVSASCNSHVGKDGLSGVTGSIHIYMFLTVAKQDQTNTRWRSKPPGGDQMVRREGRTPELPFCPFSFNVRWRPCGYASKSGRLWRRSRQQHPGRPLSCQKSPLPRRASPIFA